MRQMSPHLPQQNPELEGIFKKVLCKASLLLLEKSGVKTVDAFQKCFGPLIEEMEREKVVEKEVIEVQRDGAVSPISFEEFQVETVFFKLRVPSLNFPEQSKNRLV